MHKNEKLYIKKHFLYKNDRIRTFTLPIADKVSNNKVWNVTYFRRLEACFFPPFSLF